MGTLEKVGSFVENAAGSLSGADNKDSAKSKVVLALREKKLELLKSLTSSQEEYYIDEVRGRMYSSETGRAWVVVEDSSTHPVTKTVAEITTSNGNPVANNATGIWGRTGQFFRNFNIDGFAVFSSENGELLVDTDDVQMEYNKADGSSVKESLNMRVSDFKKEREQFLGEVFEKNKIILEGRKEKFQAHVTEYRKLDDALKADLRKEYDALPADTKEKIQRFCSRTKLSPNPKEFSDVEKFYAVKASFEKGDVDGELLFTATRAKGMAPGKEMDKFISDIGVKEYLSSKTAVEGEKDKRIAETGQAVDTAAKNVSETENPTPEWANKIRQFAKDHPMGALAAGIVVSVVGLFGGAAAGSLGGKLVSMISGVPLGGMIGSAGGALTGAALGVPLIMAGFGNTSALDAILPGKSLEEQAKFEATKHNVDVKAKEKAAELPPVEAPTKQEAAPEKTAPVPEAPKVDPLAMQDAKKGLENVSAPVEATGKPNAGVDKKTAKVTGPAIKPETASLAQAR